MKDFFTKIAMQHILIFRIFILCTSIWLVTYLMPREIRFKYEYSQGKPWLYENLYADFSFSITKDLDEINSEKEIIRAQAKQYFYKDSVHYKTQLVAFDANYNSFLSKSIIPIDSLTTDSTNFLLLSALKADYKQYLIDVYQKGILPNSVQNTSNIWFRSGSNVHLLKQNEFYSLRQVLSQIPTSKINPEIDAAIQNILAQSIQPNIILDHNLTSRDLEQTLSKIPLVKDVIEQEALIIAKGQLVNALTYQKILSYQKEFENRNTNQINIVLLWFGQILMVSLCLLVLYFFINQFREDIIENSTNMSFIFFNVVFMFAIAKLGVYFQADYIYAIPFCLLPIVLKAFYDTRLALFAHLITILLIAFLVPDSFEFIFLQLMGGIISILAVMSMYRRADIFISAVKIICVYALSYLAMEILQNTSIESIDYSKLYHLFIAGSLTIIAYPLIYIFEKLFGITSDVSLLELADTNSPLLKKLQEKAPGTFQHSLQVANLAESGVNEIGGNVLLVRVGALYHDIGKMHTPTYFIENQHTDVNPHDELEFNQSAKIIIDHVVNGVEIAKKHKLPDRIIDFIRTHHGSSTVQYFYKQYLNNFPDGKLTQNAFRYPGPKPFSKETAVLMMADSVEAASKSIKDINAQKIDGLVEKIIDYQMSSGELDNADISLKQITLIKKIFKKKLRNIYHVRIEYPE
ncbi:MAG: HD family phosphohydrolase [Flavobacteriales bacterium]